MNLKKYDGCCDHSMGEIVLAQSEDNSMNMRDQDAVDKRLLRHEIIYTFAAESGLADDSTWTTNEEMTD